MKKLRIWFRHKVSETPKIYFNMSEKGHWTWNKNLDTMSQMISVLVHGKNHFLKKVAILEVSLI